MLRGFVKRILPPMQESESLSGEIKVVLSVGFSELLLQTQTWMMLWARPGCLLNFLKPISPNWGQGTPFCTLGCFGPWSIFLFQSVAKHKSCFLSGWVQVLISSGICLERMRTELMFQGRHLAPSASLSSQGDGVFLVTHQVLTTCSKYSSVFNSAAVLPLEMERLGLWSPPAPRLPGAWSSQSFQISLTLGKLCRVLSGSRAQVCKGFEEHLDKPLEWPGQRWAAMVSAGLWRLGELQADLQGLGISADSRHFALSLEWHLVQKPGLL